MNQPMPRNASSLQFQVCIFPWFDGGFYITRHWNPAMKLFRISAGVIDFRIWWDDTSYQPPEIQIPAEPIEWRCATCDQATIDPTGWMFDTDTSLSYCPSCYQPQRHPDKAPDMTPIAAPPPDGKAMLNEQNSGGRFGFDDDGGRGGLR